MNLLQLEFDGANCYQVHCLDCARVLVYAHLGDLGIPSGVRGGLSHNMDDRKRLIGHSKQHQGGL